MKTLLELTNILNRNKLRSIEVLSANPENPTLISNLYEAILKGKVQTDDEAERLLYGPEGNRNAYYKLKHKLKERLLDTLFLIDQKKEKYPTRKTAYYVCQRELAMINILLSRGARSTAISLSEKLIKTTTKFEFTEVTVTLLRILRRHYALFEGDRRQLRNYQQLLSEYQALLTKETSAEGFFDDLASYYVRSKVPQEEIFQIASSYLQELETLPSRRSSFNLFFHTTMIDIGRLLSVGHYQNAIVLTKTGLEHVESLSYRNNNAYTLLGFQHIVCCIHLQNYSEGDRVIKKILSFQEKDQFNWFKTQELHLSLCLYTHAYDQAWEIFHSVTRRKAFSNLPQTIQEVWTIFEAWLHFLLQANQIQRAPTGTNPLRIARFINEVPNFSKDKRGLNVPILIIQVLLLIQRGRLDQVFDRTEGLEKYRDRYLGKKENLRSNLFIRILIELANAGFQPHALQGEKVQRLLAQLKGKPAMIANQSLDCEILPYEDTWEHLTRCIQDQASVRQKKRV